MFGKLIVNLLCVICFFMVLNFFITMIALVDAQSENIALKKQMHNFNVMYQEESQRRIAKGE